MAVKFYQPENQVPLEMHKVRVVQKLTLLPVQERLKAMQDAGNNTFLLQNKDIYMDMITDSGVNGMSDKQVAAMNIADDSYAGSESFNRAKAAIKEVFGVDNVLPAHQGRAAENILAETFVKPGMVTLMNFHFTTTKAHITRLGGSVVELVHKKGLIPQSDDPFKGDFDLQALRDAITEHTPEKVAFVGDRLYTDVKFAINNGMTSVLVLSGETTKEMYEESGLDIDYIYPSVNELRKI